MDATPGFPESRPPQTHALVGPALVGAYFLSGAAALVYQVLWTRRLGNVFGVTVQAASTVLACFMAGLAIGSWWVGRRADRDRNPLRVFALVECLIGVAALLTPFALTGVEGIFVRLSSVDSPALAQLLLRAGLSSLVLIVPSTLMGATYPLILRATARTESGLRTSASLLYGVNTLGAVAGVLTSAFWLIPMLGMRATFLVAAATNGLVAILALAASRTWAASSAAGGAASEPSSSGETVSVTPAGRRAVLVVMAVSGGVSLALEIVWFRVLVFFLRPTTYAFASMLAAVLVGIAAGSLLVTLWMKRRARGLATLAGLELLIGLLGLWSAPAIVKSYDVMDWVWSLKLPAPFDYIAALMVPAAFAILPTALLLGAAFPLGVVLWTSGQTGADVGRRVGTLYSLNVAGAIVGSLASGFLLVPRIGAQGTLIAATVLPLAGGLWLLYLARARGRAVIAAGCLAAFGFSTLGRPDLFASVIERRYRGREILWHREEAQATVTVMREGDQHVLLIDGMHHSSDGPDMTREHRLIGALGLALAPQPVNVLVVGLGSGSTAGGLSSTGAVRVDIVELSAAVIEAARWFNGSNHDLLKSPFVQMRVDDGRNYLQLTTKKYDIVTADLMLPYLAGAGSLYSVDYFRLARRVLASDGLMIQWIPQDHEIRYKMTLRGFLAAFPYVTAWGGGLLVGSMTPLSLDREAFERKLAEPGLAALFREEGFSSFDALLGAYVANRHQLVSYAGRGPMLTDDLPISEYFLSLPESHDAHFTFPPPDPKELLH